MRARQVAVCGPAECTPAEAAAAREVGRGLGAAGAVVLCGGGGGVMAAVAAGARSAGGLVIGIRPDGDLGGDGRGAEGGDVGDVRRSAGGGDVGDVRGSVEDGDLGDECHGAPAGDRRGGDRGISDAGSGGGDLSAVIATGLGEARNAVLVRSADAVIVVGGSWGTLSELALARRIGVPVVGLLSWRVLDADGRALTDPVPVATSAEDAVRFALDAASAR